MRSYKYARHIDKSARQHNELEDGHSLLSACRSIQCIYLFVSFTLLSLLLRAVQQISSPPRIDNDANSQRTLARLLSTCRRHSVKDRCCHPPRSYSPCPHCSKNRAGSSFPASSWRLQCMWQRVPRPNRHVLPSHMPAMRLCRDRYLSRLRRTRGVSVGWMSWTRR